MKKDKEWLKTEIYVEYNDSNFIKVAWDLIDQLGEPELTHKQVDKYLYERNLVAVDAMMVHQTGMQNKVVVEKPVIPQFVADWIEQQRKYEPEPVITAMNRLRNNGTRELMVWFESNSDLYARAWMDGYEVGEEQKYYVELLYGVLALHQFDDYYDVFDKEQIEGNEEWIYQFTEQEIKDYDERFWSFAIKVEELEE